MTQCAPYILRWLSDKLELTALKVWKLWALCLQSVCICVWALSFCTCHCSTRLQHLKLWHLFAPTLANILSSVVWKPWLCLCGSLSQSVKMVRRTSAQEALKIILGRSGWRRELSEYLKSYFGQFTVWLSLKKRVRLVEDTGEISNWGNK